MEIISILRENFNKIPRFISFKGKITTNQVIEIFEEMQDEIETNIENLNDGGCGQFAYYLGVELDKINFPYKIAIYDKLNPEKRKTFLDEVKNQQFINSRHLSASHVSVKILDFYYLDGYEFIWEGTSNIFYTLDELKLALEHGAWNEGYNKKQNRKLKRIIQKHTKKLKKYQSEPI